MEVGHFLIRSKTKKTRKILDRLTDVSRDVSSTLERRGQLHDTLKLLAADRTPDAQLTRLVATIRARLSHL